MGDRLSTSTCGSCGGGCMPSQPPSPYPQQYSDPSAVITMLHSAPQAMLCACKPLKNGTFFGSLTLSIYIKHNQLSVNELVQAVGNVLHTHRTVPRLSVCPIAPRIHLSVAGERHHVKVT